MICRFTIVAIALLMLNSPVSTFAQRQSEPEPGQERILKKSRYGDTRVSQRLPPIVDRASATEPAEAKDTGAIKRRLNDEPTQEPTAPKIELPFTPADLRDPEAILDPTTVLAIVGDSYIITGDILGDVNLTVPEFVLAPASERENILKAQVNYLRAYLGAAIETKLLYLDFMRQPRAAEMILKVESALSANFDEQVQATFAKTIAADTLEAREELKKNDPATRRIADLMVRENLSTMGEVDVALARYGTSLAKERKRYAERYAAFSVLQNLQKGNSKKEVTREQLYDYYQAHLIEFERPARSKWEKLSVKHDRFRSRDEAWNTIAKMADEVFLDGKKLSAVAKRSSQTADAADGGFHDWTSKGSLRSAVLDEAIFTLPVGRLSPILEDDEGLHVVFVIDRDDGGYESFSLIKTQELIKKKILDEQFDQARQERFAKLKREIAVWNIFDELPEE
jgi:parvulin-like peptidyl-prolyl isomerase